ncbi:hypothetical protein DL96DRAFT_1687536 [Flagelloscypha sp. PMI_526]|nr:hypothetical protein DL96DRAFT_1687536 [Flagelloscypha sp. PMI_526]
MSQSLSKAMTTLATQKPNVPLSLSTTTPSQTNIIHHSLTLGLVTAIPPSDSSTIDWGAMSTLAINFPIVSPLDGPSDQGDKTKENPNDSVEYSSSSGSLIAKSSTLENGTILFQATPTSSPVVLGTLSGLQSVSIAPVASTTQQDETNSSPSTNGSSAQKQTSTAVLAALAALIGTLLLRMAVD